jgi:hypothetical protein
LQDVERYSNGKWKAVVIGSYERADRAISLKKAISLMEFYQVPVTELFPESPPPIQMSNLAIDLARLSNEQSPFSSIVKKFTNAIANRRKDWNGQILSVRANDLQFLAMLLQQNENSVLEHLEKLGLVKT